MPRFAAIDVGSNALRLRIVEATSPSVPADESQPLARVGKGDPPAQWTELASVRAAVRLGKEVFVSRRLSPASIGEACQALREFRNVIDEKHIDAYRAVATSAVREARNGSTLIERTRREAGIALEVIEGIEEARLIQLAVRRKLALEATSALLIDVGGGSTELSFIDRGKHVWSNSLALGTVRLLETYLRDGRNMDAKRLRLLNEAIDRAIAPALPQLKAQTITHLIGTGGNVETLADLCPAKNSTLPNSRCIDTGTMRQLYRKLIAMTPNERRDSFGLRPDRADTIVPAISIFARISETLRRDALIAPGVGLTAGILEELIDKFFHVWDTAGEAETVLTSCIQLGRRYSFDEKHGRKVAKFATQLFDDLRSIHAFDERDRLLLRAGALIHDIGDFVRYDGHHKHSYYLVQHSDIMGLSRDERAIVANLARYHRKSPPETSHPNFRDLDKEARGKVRGLAALLRISDALDREHLGKIEGVRAAVDEAKHKVTLFLRGDADRELEEWTVMAKSEFLRDVYDLDVEIAQEEVAE